MARSTFALEHQGLPSNLDRSKMPCHVGIILDGNRRWACAHHHEVNEGHRIGFGKIPDVLSWCDAFNIQIVTLWMLSTDNIKNRTRAELEALYEIDAHVVQNLTSRRRFRLNVIGCLEMLPDTLAAVLRGAEKETRHVDGMLVNLAIAYGGREDILRAFRSILAAGDTRITEGLVGCASVDGWPT